MKRLFSILFSICLLCGCSKGVSSNTGESNTSNSGYESYKEMVNNLKDYDSYYLAVSSNYKISYSDSSSSIYSLDGTLEASNISSNPIANSTLNINSNGSSSNFTGVYMNNTLYNKFNSVQYYENMSYSDLIKSYLVPVKPYAFDDSIVSSCDYSNNQYTIVLNDANDIFKSRYDINGLSSYDNYKVVSNKIVDEFDSDGNFVGETTSFTISVTVSNQTVNIEYTSSVKYMNINKTSISVDDSTKSSLASYVKYSDIDVNSISSETIDDSEESTVTDTFKKRLVNRLGYTEKSSNVYSLDFNTNENYTIDFNSKNFTYSNYSIKYVYNWSGESASMNKCTYLFNNESASSECTDSALESIKNVRMYFQMELYYCGLSLEDLQSES